MARIDARRVERHAELAAQLAPTLGIEPGLLDLSVASVPHIEAVRRERGGRWLITKSRINPLVAYLDTVVVRAVGGRWVIKRDLSGEVGACIVGRDAARRSSPRATSSMRFGTACPSPS